MPDQSGSQSPPKNLKTLILPTLHDCGDRHTSTLEEPPLGLCSGSRLNASLHDIERECGNPPGNSCDASCEEQG